VPGPGDGPNVVRHVTVGCGDPYELARFWSQVTGWPLHEEDERLLGLGATVPTGGWVVMADQEGNEFCVERSQSERSATPSG
jgi:hypothetical protein